MDPFFDLLNKSVIIFWVGFSVFLPSVLISVLAILYFFKQLKSSSQFLKLQFIVVFRTTSILLLDYWR